MENELSSLLLGSRRAIADLIKPLDKQVIERFFSGLDDGFESHGVKISIYDTISKKFKISGITWPSIVEVDEFGWEERMLMEVETEKLFDRTLNEFLGYLKILEMSHAENDLKYSTFADYIHYYRSHSQYNVEFLRRLEVREYSQEFRKHFAYIAGLEIGFKGASYESKIPFELFRDLQAFSPIDPVESETILSIQKMYDYYLTTVTSQ
jgi:hypothetical protein